MNTASTYRLTFPPSMGREPHLITCDDVIFTNGFVLFRDEDKELVEAYPRDAVLSIVAIND